MFIAAVELTVNVLARRLSCPIPCNKLYLPRTEVTASRRIPNAILLLVICCLPFPGCSRNSSETASSASNQRRAAADSQENTEPTVLRLASTTSTRDSGLFDLLLPEFETSHNCRVDLIAVGTGAALKLGETGDVDALLVHARNAEDAFMAAGHGIRHEPVMHNFFLIAGPADDPAEAGGSDAVAALKRIAAGQHRFISRGDDSGTHKRELLLWQKAGGRPEWENYIECGQGMGPTLLMADEKNAYVLTDEGTWIKRKDAFRLKALVTEAEVLKNPYAVMVVAPQKHPAINAELADQFADFLISETAQKLIAGYQVNGRILFQPDRLSVEPVPAGSAE